MSAPRPSETDPFRPLGSTTITYNFVYIQKCTRYFFHVVRLVWCAFRNCACALAGKFTLRFFVISKAILTSMRFLWVRHDICTCALREQAKSTIISCLPVEFQLSVSDLLSFACFSMQKKSKTGQ